MVRSRVTNDTFLFFFYYPVRLYIYKTEKVTSPSGIASTKLNWSIDVPGRGCQEEQHKTPLNRLMTLSCGQWLLGVKPCHWEPAFVLENFIMDDRDGKKKNPQEHHGKNRQSQRQWKSGHKSRKLLIELLSRCHWGSSLCSSSVFKTWAKKSPNFFLHPPKTC